MSHYEPSVSLHQQDGGISVLAFAEQHGMTLSQMRHHVKKGRVIGARQDSRSRKWTIYPPAKLVDISGDCMKQRKAVTKTPGGYLDESPMDLPDLLPGTDGFDFGISPHGLPVGLPLPVQETCETSNLAPPAKRSFNPFERCATVGALAPTVKQRAAVLPDVYASSEVKRIRQALQEASARAHREGIHYLHLDSREFSQLYAALAHERSRIRKLSGKGLVDVGNLRASDSVWQKLQAMCHEGRLL